MIDTKATFVKKISGFTLSVIAVMPETIFYHRERRGHRDTKNRQNAKIKEVACKKSGLKFCHFR